MLRYTDSAVTEILDRLCFEDVSCFIRYFRRPVGCTLLQFRERAG